MCDLCPCVCSPDCIIHHWLAGTVSRYCLETHHHIQEDVLKKEGSFFDAYFQCGLCSVLLQTEALCWMQRSLGSRALLAVCLGPEWKESQDPQSAAEHHRPPAGEVNHVHRFFLSFFLATRWYLAGEPARPKTSLLCFFFRVRVSPSINPPKKIPFFPLCVKMDF